MAAVVRLRGLPFRATTRDVQAWLQTGGVGVTEESIRMQFGHDGRPTGQCFVTLASADDNSRVSAMDRKQMGTRYIEVHPSSFDELEKTPQGMPGMGMGMGMMGMGMGATSGLSGAQGVTGATGDDLVVKLRGLPFAATELDIANFFQGVNIANQGIHMVLTPDNRPSGQAFVELQGSMDLVNALAKDRQLLGHRYVEVFPSSRMEMHSGGDSGGYGGYGGMGGMGGDYGGGGGGFSPYGGGGGGAAGQQMKPGDWNCHECGFHNFRARTQCKNCNAVRKM